MRVQWTRWPVIWAAALVGPAPAVDEAGSAVGDFHFIPGTFDPRVGPDGNTVIYTAPSGLVVIDTGRHPAHAQAIIGFAESKNLPVVAVVNTHWHLDHATGNLDMKAIYPEAAIYATRAIEGALHGFLASGIDASRQLLYDPAADTDLRARATRMLAAVDRGVMLPDVPVLATMSLPVVGRDLEFNVTHHAVTESDLWIWDPATRTVIAGDLITLPVPLFDTACAEGWRQALDAIERKPFERIVPGHGFPMDAGDFRLYRQAFDRLLACAAEKTGAECAQGWLADAAPLLAGAAGEDYGDTDYARAAATYYVDEIIRAPGEQTAVCAQQNPGS